MKTILKISIFLLFGLQNTVQAQHTPEYQDNVVAGLIHKHMYKVAHRRIVDAERLKEKLEAFGTPEEGVEIPALYVKTQHQLDSFLLRIKNDALMLRGERGILQPMPDLVESHLVEARYHLLKNDAEAAKASFDCIEGGVIMALTEEFVALESAYIKEEINRLLKDEP